MENVVMSRQKEEKKEEEESDVFDDKKLPIMRTLARFHECDAETLLSRVDASELDVRDILKEMISLDEVEATPKLTLGAGPSGKLTLTLKGWGEYMKVLGSIYELPE
jgi:hypothetical protein